MLDKSVKYYHIIMRRKKGTFVPHFSLPEGYKYVIFKSGDEKEWAEIEASVKEFDRAVDALVYFQKDYMPFLPEVERRTIFIEDGKGEKIATATNWFAYTGVRRDPWIHWVAVKPAFQGLGLGKAIISEAVRRMIDIEGDRDIYLHTQTWSYKAIGIYMKCGFKFAEEKELGGLKNEYECAVPLLNKLIKI